MGGRSQDWVTEGHWSRLLGGFGLQAGWENMGKRDKGSSKQEGETSPSWLCLWGLRVRQNPETFTSGLPALLIFTTRGHKRHSSRKRVMSSMWLLHLRIIWRALKKTPLILG